MINQPLIVYYFPEHSCYNLMFKRSLIGKNILNILTADLILKRTRALIKWCMIVDDETVKTSPTIRAIKHYHSLSSAILHFEHFQKFHDS